MLYGGLEAFECLILSTARTKQDFTTVILEIFAVEIFSWSHKATKNNVATFFQL